MILGFKPVLRKKDSGETVLPNNVFIGGVAATMYSPATIRPKLNYIAAEHIKNVIVEGEDISFRIDVDYSISNWAWRHVLDIKWFKDMDGRCKSINEATFRRSALWDGRLTHIYLPGLETVSSLYNFYRNSYMQEIVMTSPNLLKLGATASANDSTFGGGAQWGGCKLWIHDNLRTNNGGAREADLASFNGTIIYVTNFTAPEAITDFTATEVFDDSAEFTWSVPTNINGIMRYEIYVDGELAVQTKKTSIRVAGLTYGAVHKVQIKTIDNFYNISEFGNTAWVLVNGPTVSWQDSLISYYNFDDNVLDVMGNNDGTAYNILYEPGISGNAITLNDVNAYVNLNSSNIVGGKNAFSIVVAFKMNALVDNNIIYGSWISPNTTILRVHTGQLQFYTFTEKQVGGNIVAFTDTTQFHHLVATYDGARMKLYLDGVLQSTTYKQTGVTGIGGESEAWGKERTNYGNFTLDSGGLLDKALTQSEVDELYAIYLQGNELKTT